MTCVINESKAAAEQYPNCYAPIPPNGQQCPHTGLKHAKLYTLLATIKGRVRVANLREDGASRGKTLFHVGDMLRYLDSLAATQSSVEE